MNIDEERFERIKKGIKIGLRDSGYKGYGWGIDEKGCPTEDFLTKLTKCKMVLTEEDLSVSAYDQGTVANVLEIGSKKLKEQGTPIFTQDEWKTLVKPEIKWLKEEDAKAEVRIKEIMKGNKILAAASEKQSGSDKQRGGI